MLRNGLEMKELFIISKNPSLSNYIFMLVNEIVPNSCSLAPEFTANLDLVIVDSDTISPQEVIQQEINSPIVLYANEIKPLLIQYTSILDINGIISLTMEADDILKTMRSAFESDIFYNEAMIAMLFSNKANDIAERISSLTSRENEILQLMMKDMTNEEIAEMLDLSVRTVNAHKGNVMRKIGTKTTSGLIQTLLDYSPNFKNSL